MTCVCADVVPLRILMENHSGREIQEISASLRRLTHLQAGGSTRASLDYLSQIFYWLLLSSIIFYFLTNATGATVRHTSFPKTQYLQQNTREVSVHLEAVTLSIPGEVGFAGSTFNANALLNCEYFIDVCINPSGFNLALNVSGMHAHT